MINVIINNRAEGNAPLIAQVIVEKFLKKVKPTPKPKRQLSFWGIN